MKPLHNEELHIALLLIIMNIIVWYILQYLKEHNFHFQSRHCHSVIIYHPGERVNEFFRSLTPRCNKKMHYDHSLRSAARWFMMGSSNEKFILLACLLFGSALDEFLMMPFCYQRKEKEFTYNK